MPRRSMLLTAAVVSVFAIFAAVLLWGISDPPEDASAVHAATAPLLIPHFSPGRRKKAIPL